MKGLRLKINNNYNNSSSASINPHVIKPPMFKIPFQQVNQELNLQGFKSGQRPLIIEPSEAAANLPNILKSS